MGGEVRVSYPRLDQYASLCRDQSAYLGAVDQLVSGACADFGAFTGFMALFADAYRSAHETVAASLDDGRRAARSAADAFDAVAAELRSTDGLVRDDLERVQVRTEGADPYSGPGAVGSPGGVPGGIKYVNGVATNIADATDTMAGPNVAPDHGIRGLPTGAVDLTANVTDTITTGVGLGETADDIDDYEDFEDEHGGSARGRGEEGAG